MSWLSNVPVSEEAYVFQTRLYCEDCGLTAVKALRSQDVEDEGDSDTFPQGPYPYGVY